MRAVRVKAILLTELNTATLQYCMQDFTSWPVYPALYIFDGTVIYRGSKGKDVSVLGGWVGLIDLKNTVKQNVPVYAIGTILWVRSNLTYLVYDTPPRSHPS